MRHGAGRQRGEIAARGEGVDPGSVRAHRARALVLHQAHIDPYEKAASINNHEPKRERKLLVHKRELKRLTDATAVKGTTLVPLAIYFKDGRAKLELGVARGKHQHDKRETIKRKEQDRELRRMQMTRR